MGWRPEPIQRQMQKLEQRQRLRLKQKQTPTTLTTLEVIMVVRDITLEGKMVVKGITLEDKMVARAVILEVRGHTLHTLVCQGVMEGGCHLHMLPYKQAGLATLSL